MSNVEVRLDRDSVIGVTDPRLFGAFIEHVGRCVYGGIYEPGHPKADKKGFRKDVLALVRELAPTIVRYPGGNFVSGYNWEDGVGPAEDRPTRLDLAWMSTEPNIFGTNEYVDWCRTAAIEPMLAVNLGTRGGDAARNLVEYCNHPKGTALSDLRRRHGYEAPHGIKLWCLGNEMDGWWQMGTKTATEYGRMATEAAKMMKWIDPSIELAACGSSGRTMPSFGTWDDTVLEHTFEHVEFISLHTYLNNYADDTPAFLASPDMMDRFIEEVIAVADAVAARRRSSKRIMLSFDEWNVWYRTRRNQRVKPGWPVAPKILEEAYNMQDALTFGGACISLLNHSDRVKVACLAQLVNVIAPIMTEAGGAAWRQTIFYPFADFSNLGRGTVLSARVNSPTYAANYLDPRGTVENRYPLPAVPYLKLSAVHDDRAGTLTLFALNRHLKDDMTVDFATKGFAKLAVAKAHQLHDEDLKALNTAKKPNRIRPLPLPDITIRSGGLRARLGPASWNVIRLKAGR